MENLKDRISMYVKAHQYPRDITDVVRVLFAAPGSTDKIDTNLNNALTELVREGRLEIGFSRHGEFMLLRPEE